jgi:creatinine amidohydrolase
VTHDQGEIGFDMPATTTDDSGTEDPVALLPIGSFEQHGPYLPLVTDTLIATVIADSISRQHKVFQLPVLAFGCSQEYSDFPGTVSIGATTLHSIVNDVIDSLKRALST